RVTIISPIPQQPARNEEATGYFLTRAWNDMNAASTPYDSVLTRQVGRMGRMSVSARGAAGCCGSRGVLRELRGRLAAGLGGQAGGEAGSGGDAELAERVPQVGLHRGLGDEQVLGDLPVARALGGQGGDPP